MRRCIHWSCLPYHHSLGTLRLHHARARVRRRDTSSGRCRAHHSHHDGLRMRNDCSGVSGRLSAPPGERGDDNLRPTV